MCSAPSGQELAKFLGLVLTSGQEQLSRQLGTCDTGPVLPPQIEGHDVAWTPPHLLRDPDAYGRGLVEPPIEIIGIQRDHGAPYAFHVAAGQPILPVGLVPLAEADHDEGCGGRVDAHRVL